MALIKIEIKRRYSNKVLFSYESENNTMKDTLVEAVKKGTDLSYADLYGADLRNADLGNANLRNADLGNASLSYADLRCADLRNASLRNANLSYANLYGADLRNADLRNADLRNANLWGANLYGADLRNVYLRNADLRYANLGNADLSNADLINADLGDADLSNADLTNADLRNANLTNVNLSNANLGNASLGNANLRNAKNIPFIPLACPSEGAFIGWKKVKNHLIKLQIPEDAKRSSAISQKCRCDKALVLAITNIDGTNPISEIENIEYSPSVLYKVGEMVIPDSFDEDRWNECSNGIHFFINKQNAIDY